MSQKNTKGSEKDWKVEKTTDDALVIMCESVCSVLKRATRSNISFSPMLQKISRTCLKPDIGCFMLFDGGFSGLVILNFSAASAVEMYRRYMLSMGLPDEELAKFHTSAEVSDGLGELMNQIVGDFRVNLENRMRISVTQNQPRMVVITKELSVSIHASIDRPLCRRISFKTQDGAPFYMETAIENVKFSPMHYFEEAEAVDPEKLIAEKAAADRARQKKGGDKADDAFMKDLGL